MGDTYGEPLKYLRYSEHLLENKQIRISRKVPYQRIRLSLYSKVNSNCEICDWLKGMEILLLIKRLAAQRLSKTIIISLIKNLSLSNSHWFRLSGSF